MKHLFSKLPLIGFLVAIPIIAVLSNLAGCANIIPPTGGPRDSLPPMLLSVNPPDSSTNITPKRIVFQFDVRTDDLITADGDRSYGIWADESGCLQEPIVRFGFQRIDEDAPESAGLSGISNVPSVLAE